MELYKFVQDKEIDWRGDKLILWLDPDDLNEFAEMLGYDYLCEGGIEVSMLGHGIIALDLIEHLEWFDIEPTNILSKEE